MSNCVVGLRRLRASSRDGSGVVNRPPSPPQYAAFPTYRRREFITLLSGAAAAWPIAARTQGLGQIYRLGELSLTPRNAPWHVALFDAVKSDGLIAGQNLVVDDEGFGLGVGQLAEHASAIVKARVDVINAGGDPPVRAAQQATKEIPILGVAEDMVGSRFVASLANPGDRRQHPFQ